MKRGNSSTRLQKFKERYETLTAREREVMGLAGFRHAHEADRIETRDQRNHSAGSSRPSDA